jgi:hypothetical protein
LRLVAFGLVSTHLATLSSFMQEKYKRRKQKKYAPHVLVRRPSARRCFDCAVCVKPTLLKTPTRLGIVTPTFSACTVFLKLLGDVANRTATISMRR